MLRTSGHDEQSDRVAPTQASRHHHAEHHSHGPGSLLRLQRLAGNRAVSTLTGPVPRTPSRLRRSCSVTIRRPLLLAQAALERSERMRAAITVRLGKLAAYNAAADAALTNYQNVRLDFAGRWGSAWERHHAKLTEGNQEAASENLVEGIVIGVVAAVLVTAAATLVLPAAAGAEAFSATWWAFNVGSNTASTALGTGVATVVGRPGIDAPSTGRRDQEADAWRAIAEKGEQARRVAGLAPRFGLALGNAEYCIAQVHATLNQGKPDMPWPQTLDMVSTLAGWETALAPFDQQIDAKIESMTAFGQAAATFVVPSVDVLERDIWRAWMSTLTTTTDEALDQDVIQKYLVKLGLITDYFYMTDEDQHQEVANAKRYLQDARPAP